MNDPASGVERILGNLGRQLSVRKLLESARDNPHSAIAAELHTLAIGVVLDAAGTDANVQRQIWGRCSAIAGLDTPVGDLIDSPDLMADVLGLIEAHRGEADLADKAQTVEATAARVRGDEIRRKAKAAVEATPADLRGLIQAAAVQEGAVLRPMALRPLLHRARIGRDRIEMIERHLYPRMLQHVTVGTIAAEPELARDVINIAFTGNPPAGMKDAFMFTQRRWMFGTSHGTADAPVAVAQRKFYRWPQ